MLCDLTGLRTGGPALHGAGGGFVETPWCEDPQRSLRTARDSQGAGDDLGAGAPNAVGGDRALCTVTQR